MQGTPPSITGTPPSPGPEAPVSRCVVLEAANSADRAGRTLDGRRTAAELRVAAADVVADLVDEVGGGAESGRRYAGGDSAPAQPADPPATRPAAARLNRDWICGAARGVPAATAGRRRPGPETALAAASAPFGPGGQGEGAGPRRQRGLGAGGLLNRRFLSWVPFFAGTFLAGAFFTGAFLAGAASSQQPSWRPGRPRGPRQPVLLLCHLLLLDLVAIPGRRVPIMPTVGLATGGATTAAPAISTAAPTMNGHNGIRSCAGRGLPRRPRCAGTGHRPVNDHDPRPRARHRK